MTHTIGAGMTERKITIATGDQIPVVEREAREQWEVGLSSGRAFALGVPIPGRTYDEDSANALEVARAVLDRIGEGPHLPDTPGDFAARLIVFDRKRAEALANGEATSAAKFERQFFKAETEARLKFEHERYWDSGRRYHEHGSEGGDQVSRQYEYDRWRTCANKIRSSNPRFKNNKSEIARRVIRELKLNHSLRTVRRVI